MRLVKTSGNSQQGIHGQEAFDQLRDLGSRLEYVVARYGRLVMDVTDGRPLPDMKDAVEMMNNQLGYVARRLQEALLAEYEQRHGEAEAEGASAYSREMAVASR